MPPKSRAAKRSHRIGFGRVSDGRVAWLRTMTSRQVAMVRTTEEQMKERYDFIVPGEEGDAICVFMQVPGRARALIWDITGMTTEELEATRGFFEYVFSQAEPIIRQRDRIAHEAAETGDSSYTRVYRETPLFVVREGKVTPNSQGVYDGSTDASGPDGSSADFGVGLPDSGNGLAYQVPNDNQLQDDSSENDLG